MNEDLTILDAHWCWPAIVRQSYPTNTARAQQLAKMAEPKLAKPAQALELYGCRKAR